MDSQEFIYGRNSVKELLKQKPEFVGKLFIRQQLQGKAIRDLEALASSNRVPVQRVHGKKLAELVGPVNDQGVVASVSMAEYLELNDWISRTDISTQPVVLALDEIEDPHNFGALIRTAAAAGVAAVMVSKHRQAPLSGAVMKASAGIAIRMPVIRVVNINQALLVLKESGYWICGTDMNGEQTIWQQKYDFPLVVIIGSEEKGIRRKTREHCDMLVRIPMQNGVESLNASVSGALICYEILRQRQLHPV
ncbi:MAG: 23S rRNA (guanosine(2251)-2'-O)-methyltransferase RlmB [Balneolales bacterium]